MALNGFAIASLVFLALFILLCVIGNIIIKHTKKNIISKTGNYIAINFFGILSLILSILLGVKSIKYNLFNRLLN